jgi:hypothetical protein
MLAGYSMWELSVQQINSCTAGTFGCGGGDTTGAYEQLMSGETKANIKTPGMQTAGALVSTALRLAPPAASAT